MNLTLFAPILPWVKRCWIYLAKILSSAFRFLFHQYMLLYALGFAALSFFAICLLAVIVPYGILEKLGTGALSLLGSGDKALAIRFLGTAIGGSILFLGLVIADRRAKAMEDSANAQTEANKNAERGQRQERLKNAIEHLGDTSDSVRLGGAYELFHLAQDTEELRQTVLDILCAHIRGTTSGSEYRDKHNLKPSEEIQSLLTLLFVQNHQVFKDCHINLQGSWLNGAKLSGARLGKAILDEVHLCGAYLDGADLQKAQLCQTHLQGAYLMYAEMREVVLLRAHLQKAEIRLAKLTSSNISEANLHAADLWKANIRGSCLDKARLHGANLVGANLQASRLSEASLYGANLSRAGLQGANLQQAEFQGASFGGTRLQGANLRHVRLQGVKNERWRHGFRKNINESIGNAANLSGMIFTGGLGSEDLDSIVEDLPNDKATALRKKLIADVDKPASHELSEDSDAITGSYTEEEAEQWVAEYEQAMSEVPEKDDI